MDTSSTGSPPTDRNKNSNKNSNKRSFENGNISIDQKKKGQQNSKTPNEASTWKGSSSNMSSSGSEQPLGPGGADPSASNSVTNQAEPLQENESVPESAGPSEDPRRVKPPKSKMKKGKSSRRSSLEMRKLPVNVLLKPDESRLSDEDLSCYDGENDNEALTGRTLLQRTCLNSKFTLRMQMLLSFGVISASTIFLVVIVCIAVSVFAGEVVKEETRSTFNHVSQELEAKATRYIAEDLTPRLLMEDAVQLLHEITLDRFFGYPNPDDSAVPYFDTLTQSNKYPIQGKPLPLDWQIEANVNPDNAAEHVQDRLSFWAEGAKISTINAAYFMQGMCDPNEMDPTQITYLEGCTEEHNNITSGGVYAPSPTNEAIHRKAADIVPILKSLYEFHQELRAVAVFFSNSGAGSTVTYPGSQVDGTSTYTSIGCEYLSGPHPLNASRSILSDEEVERCRGNNGFRVENASIPARLYSPLDRGWCQKQILNPGKVVTTGPFLDAWTGKLWLMSVGRAIYDPVTKELIACTNLDLDVETALGAIVKGSTVTDNSHVTVVRWDREGTVVSSSAWNMKNATVTVPVSALDVGVSEDAYNQFYHLVDYHKEWNASEIEAQYEEFLVIDGGYQVKAYPMPPIPEEYDPTYEPIFLVLFSVSEADIFVFADRVDEKVDDKVVLLIILSVSVGMAGLGVILAILVAVSNHVTRPLRKMDETAIRIIDNFGGDAKIEVEDTTKETKGWVKTELSEIVSEFQRMVRKFSGGAMARAAKANISEVDNRFMFLNDFQDLYASRRKKDFKYDINESKGESKEDSNDNDSSVAMRQHFGSNIISGSASTRNSVGQTHLLKSTRETVYSSPLFKWIVILVVLPLLLSTITISAAVIATVSDGLPDLIGIAENGLIDLQVEGLVSAARLRAGYVSRSSEQSVRDLHVLARYTSWLLFGAVDTVAFPELIAAADYCKEYAANATLEECPYFLEHHSCDCAWNDLASAPPCDNFADASTHSRRLQGSFFVGNSQDVDENGNSMPTTFPELAYSPETTAWWRDQHSVPGSPSNGFLGANNVTGGAFSEVGYKTTYGRLRAGGASPIYVPLYNYDIMKETVLGAYTFFEADGLYLSYRGCRNMYHATAALFRSTVANEAASLRPELCPLDKYGFDGRCRGWYESGRQHYLKEGKEMHVTPPYVFAVSTTIGQSCTAPIFDPETKEHLGQLLIDFVSTSIFKSLDDDRTPLVKGGFKILITMEKDIYDADVVIGPGLSILDQARPLQDVVNAPSFDGVASSMKAGEDGRSTFTMQDEEGNDLVYHVAYSPVVVKSLKQVDSSDFSRGVILEDYQLYSIAFAEPESSILESFEETEADIEIVMHVGLGVLATLIVLATILVVVLSHRIVVSMTEPMYYLLELIRSINRLDVDEDPPDENLHGGYGSSEVLNVRITMEKLYKIIQCANAAYFAGETEFAYEVFADALQMFERLDNKKAIAVASNNLGNTMLTFYRTMQATGNEVMCGISKRQIIGKGMAYFHKAIQLGEKAYDAFYEAEGWSPNCLHFMQHLSNRYFNRAMFLLTVKDDHEKPAEIEELGWRDIQIARDMDVEIVDEGSQVGWGVRSAEARLEVLLCRIRGHVTLLEAGYPDDWDVEEMLENAFKILQTEMKKSSSDIFLDVGPACRMQQIEFLLIRYYRVKGQLETAARVAIRMLVEDEFTLPDAQQAAVETIIDYAKATKMPSYVQKQLQDYSDWLRDTVDELDTQRSSKDVIENTRNSFVSTNMALSTRLLEIEKSNPNSVASLRESMRGDITMEAF